MCSSIGVAILISYIWFPTLEEVAVGILPFTFEVNQAIVLKLIAGPQCARGVNPLACSLLIGMILCRSCGIWRLCCGGVCVGANFLVGHVCNYVLAYPAC